MSTLGDLIVSRGGTVNPASSPDEEFELYSIPAHDRGGPELVRGAEIKSSKQIVEPGDVMISKIIPHIRRARVVSARTGRRQIASGEWIVFRGDGFHPPYLKHFLLSDGFHRQFMNTVAGVGGSLVRARPQLVKAIPVHLPHLDEQRRIAGILDHADALRAKRRQSLAYLDDLTRSVFDDMFGSYPWSATLADLAHVQIGPFGSLLHQSDYVRGGVAVLNPMHIRGGQLEPDRDFSVTQEKAASLARYRLCAGDVVMGRRGEMGRAGVAHPGQVGMLCGTGSLILRPTRSRAVFLHAVVTSLRMKGHLERNSLGATLPNLNAEIVKSSPAPNPDQELQQAFDERVSAIARTRSATLAAALVDADLFATLQSRAFRGELP